MALRRALERPLGALAEVARLRATHPMVDAVVEEIDGRRIRVGGRWLVDFASCNYLGFDLDPEIIAAVPPYLARWGTHPSWARMIGGPRIFHEIEETLAALLGTDDALLFPTISHIHLSVLPALAGTGTIFLDSQAHRTLYDGTVTAAALGAEVIRFPSGDLTRLAELLAACTRSPKIVCADGVNSMTGNISPIAGMARLARLHGAFLYIDDAHGFGVFGERTADESSPFGSGGAGVVRHSGLDYDDIVLVGGFSKAYSSLLAFVACPTDVKNFLKVSAGSYTFSGPSPIASLATVQVGLRVNAERGDVVRADLFARTARVLAGLAALGIRTLNRSGFPIIEIPVGEPGDIDGVGRYLFNHGIYVTLAPYPVVPRGQVGFRVQVTAANTEDEIEHLLGVILGLSEVFGLQSAEPANG